MSATGTPKASPAAVTAVQEALRAHYVTAATENEGANFGWKCTCGADTSSDFGRWALSSHALFAAHRDHVAVAAADAAAPHNAATALREAAESHRNARLSTQQPIWPAELDDRADRIEASRG